MAQEFLHVDEQTSVTREGEHHVKETPKDLVPVFDADQPLMRGGVAAIMYLRQAAQRGGQVQPHVDCVH